MKNAIHIEKLDFAYQTATVLRALTFSIKAGEFFIVIGPNGSGKTTLMKMLARIVAPTGGRIDVFGKDIARYGRRALARRIAYVPQMTSVDFPFTVRELVLMGRAPYLGVLGVENSKDMDIAGQAIHDAGIAHLADRRFSRLSGGECQRVFIARAICQEPDIILLDEPTAALDLAHQIRVMDVMTKLKQDRGITVVMVSHDLNLAAMYGDRLLLLKDGGMSGIGTSKDVMTSEILEAAYGCRLLLDHNPVGGCPRVTPVSERVCAGVGDAIES